MTKIIAIINSDFCGGIREAQLERSPPPPYSVIFHCSYILSIFKIKLRLIAPPPTLSLKLG